MNTIKKAALFFLLFESFFWAGWMVLYYFGLIAIDIMIESGVQHIKPISFLFAGFLSVALMYAGFRCFVVFIENLGKYFKEVLK